MVESQKVLLCQSRVPPDLHDVTHGLRVAGLLQPVHFEGQLQVWQGRAWKKDRLRGN